MTVLEAIKKLSQKLKTRNFRSDPDMREAVSLGHQALVKMHISRLLGVNMPLTLLYGETVTPRPAPTKDIKL